MTTARAEQVSRPTHPPSGGIPTRPWSEVHHFVNSTWDPENTPHHSVIGLTGSGKSYLCLNGLLRPMCHSDRVLIVDVKQNDKLVSGAPAKPVREIPQQTWRTRKREPYDMWYRLVVHDQMHEESREKAKLQVFKAIDRVYNEGDWVVFFDEFQDIGGLRHPNLGLAGPADELYRKGRSRHISVLASTQAPRHVPTSFYDQASFAWFGRLADEDKQKRLREIGGMSKEHFPVIAGLAQREWLLSADSGREFMISTVKVKEAQREVKE